MSDGPSFETEIWEYYQQTHPGEVQCIGPDDMNGTSAQLATFRDIIGATFPLLLDAATASGGNIKTLYGDRDDYVVISKQGIVRYHASLVWPFGSRYHRDEIRGAVDSLVSPTVSVIPARTELRLAAAPNPFRDEVSLTLALATPAARARLVVVDVAGREVARLYDGALGAGEAPFTWDGRDASGARCPAGVFMVSTDLDGRRLQRRLVRLP